MNKSKATNKLAMVIVDALNSGELNLDNCSKFNPEKSLEIGIDRETNQVFLRFKEEILNFDDVAAVKEFIMKLEVAIRIVELIAPNFN